MKRAAAMAMAIAACGTACGTTRTEAVIERGAERVWAGDIEVARSETDRRTGLRDHAQLGMGEGLLLEAPIEDELCIQNTGVTFAIDAAFADASGNIVAIEREIPAGDGLVRCHASSRFILETRGTELAAARLSDVLTYTDERARR